VGQHDRLAALDLAVDAIGDLRVLEDPAAREREVGERESSVIVTRSR